MERLSFVLLVLLAGCAPHSRPQTGYPPVVVGTITEQQSQTIALLQAVSAVNDSVVWVSGHQATWVRTADGGRTWVPGAMTGPDSALEFRDVEAVSITTAYLLAAGPGEQSRIYKTTDAGRSWRLQFMNRDSAAFYDCFAFWDETHGIAISDAVGGKMIVIRTDDGEHWSAVAEDGMPPALPGEGSPAAGGTCVTVGGPCAGMVRNGAPCPSLSLRRSGPSLGRGDDADRERPGRRRRHTGLPRRATRHGAGWSSPQG